MHKAIIVVDFAYKGPKRRGRGTGHQGLKATLKYLQYRDKTNNALAQTGGYERWNDRGLGVHHAAIYERCKRFQSQHVLAWTWVISPDPALMALVPENQRRALLGRLTECIVEDYYQQRGFDVPEYSYVLHKRLTPATDDKAAQEHLHTHVVLPGTAPSVAGRLPVYNNASKGHDRLFRQIATDQFKAALDAYLGLERSRRQDRQASPVDPARPADGTGFFSPSLGGA